MAAQTAQPTFLSRMRKWWYGLDNWGNIRFAAPAPKTPRFRPCLHPSKAKGGFKSLSPIRGTNMIQRQQLQRDGTLADLTHKDRSDSTFERGSFMFTDGKRNPAAPGRFRVFVYGTLKTGFGNNGILQTQGAKFLCNAYLKGFIMFSCGTAFPAIVQAPNPDWKVFGELYEVEQSHINQMDRLEGVPG